MRPDGGIVAQSGGISLAAKPTAGRYILNFGSAVTGKLILANGGVANDSGFRGVVIAGPCGGGTEGIACATANDANHVFVYSAGTDNVTATDHAFYVAVIG